MKELTAANSGIQEYRRPHHILRDAWESIKVEGGTQFDSQLAQGRTIKGIADDFKARGWTVDVYEALVVMSKEDPKAYSKYTARHLRHLGTFASLYDEMTTDCMTAPRVTMSHYLAVAGDALPLEKKHTLLILAEKYDWSVKNLKERVCLELGIGLKKDDDDKFGDALGCATDGINELIKLMAEPCSEPEENNKRITHLWRFNLLLAEYGKAFVKIAPAAAHGSVTVIAAALASPSTVTSQPHNDDDPDDPKDGMGALTPIPVGNEMDVVPVVWDQGELRMAA